MRENSRRLVGDYIDVRPGRLLGPIGTHTRTLQRANPCLVTEQNNVFRGLVARQIIGSIGEPGTGGTEDRRRAAEVGKYIEYPSLLTQAECNNTE